MKKRWQVDVVVGGLFTPPIDYVLCRTRFKWWAMLKAHWLLKWHPARAVNIHEVTVDES